MKRPRVYNSDSTDDSSSETDVLDESDESDEKDDRPSPEELWEEAKVLKQKFSIPNRMMKQEDFLLYAKVIMRAMKDAPNAGQVMTGVFMYTNRVRGGRFISSEFISKIMVLCNPVKSGKTRAIMCYLVLLKQCGVIHVPERHGKKARKKKGRPAGSHYAINGMMTKAIRVTEVNTALVLVGNMVNAKLWQGEAARCGVSSRVADTSQPIVEDDISAVDLIITTCKEWKRLNEDTREVEWTTFIYDDPVKNVCSHFRDVPNSAEHIMVVSDWRSLATIPTAANNYVKTTIAGLYDPKNMDELGTSLLRMTVVRTCLRNDGVNDTAVMYRPVYNDAVLSEAYPQFHAIIINEDWAKLRKSIFPTLKPADAEEPSTSETLVGDVLVALGKDEARFDETAGVLTKAIDSIPSNSTEGKRLSRQRLVHVENATKTREMISIIERQATAFAARDDKGVIVGRAAAFNAAIAEALVDHKSRVVVVSTSHTLCDEVMNTFPELGDGKSGPVFSRAEPHTITNRLRDFNRIDQEAKYGSVLLLRVASISDLGSIDNLHVSATAIVFCGGLPSHDAVIKGTVLRIDRRAELPPLSSMRISPYK